MDQRVAGKDEVTGKNAGKPKRGVKLRSVPSAERMRWKFPCHTSRKTALNQWTTWMTSLRISKAWTSAGFSRMDCNEAKPPVLSTWEPPTPEDLQGALPRHEIVRLIGRGGMGAVYEARQLDFDRRVAVKLLPVELCADEAFAERFRREARMMGRLRHPNILEVHEFGESTAGHLYFTMEYVEGGDLGARLQRGPLGGE